MNIDEDELLRILSSRLSISLSEDFHPPYYEEGAYVELRVNLLWNRELGQEPVVVAEDKIHISLGHY